jgi:hypothetical protein
VNDPNDPNDPMQLARAVREALGALTDSTPGALAARFTAPLVTALVADASEDAGLVPALVEVSRALERVGVPRGRQFVLLGHGGAVRRAELRARVARLRGELALALVAHDSAGPTFTVGQAADGTPIELDDELREAEAILCIGRSFAAAGRVHGGPYLLVPGVASQRTRDAIAAARTRGGEDAGLALALEAERLAPVDLAVGWDDHGRVLAGRGCERFAALARAARFA